MGHKQSKHEQIQYSCDECEYKALHIDKQSKKISDQVLLWSMWVQSNSQESAKSAETI